MIKQAVKGFLVFAIIIVNIMWAAWILTAIWRGVDFHETFNAVIMATLCLLCWLMVRRIEALTNQKRDMLDLAIIEHNRHFHLIEIILDVKKMIADGEKEGRSADKTLASVKEKLTIVKDNVDMTESLRRTDV